MADSFLTKIINGAKNADAAVHEAAEILKSGEVCALPTETVYGLAANAYDEKAVSKIFEAKGRPQDNPLICHISNLSMLEEIAADIPSCAYKLAEKFWSGPLSMVFKKTDKIPERVSGGLDTVAVRMPDNSLIKSVISECGFPLAAPSANVSGRPSPTCAEDVYFDLNGKIPLIIDGGECKVGVESTVIDVTGSVPVILRPGEITADMIANITGSVKIHEGLKDVKETPPSPGMKYRHYSPNTRIITYAGEKNAVAKTIMSRYYLYKDKAAVICGSEIRDLFKGVRVIDLGESKKSAQQKLFAALRLTDRLSLKEAFFCYEDYMGEAVLNRITKASAEIIVV